MASESAPRRSQAERRSESEEPTPDGRALLVMWGATFPSDSSIEGMVEADRRAYQGWTELIVAGQKDGSVRDDLDPGAAAVLLHGTIRGVAALLLTDSKITDMQGVRQTCHAWVNSALAANPSGSQAGATGAKRGGRR